MSRITGSVKVIDELDFTGARTWNNGELFFPTASTTIVGRDTVDTLSNKTLINPIIASINNGGNILVPQTAPATTTQFVARDTVDTLTNKTITGSSNVVEATALRSGSNWTTQLAGAAPSNGQVITFNGSNAVWATPVESNTKGTLQTTDGTATTIESFVTAADKTYALETSVVARRSDSGAESAAYFLRGCFRNNGDVVTQIGTTDRLEFEDATAWDASFSISGNAVLLLVTGEAAKTIEWTSVTTTNRSN